MAAQVLKHAQKMRSREQVQRLRMGATALPKLPRRGRPRLLPEPRPGPRWIVPVAPQPGPR